MRDHRFDHRVGDNHDGAVSRAAPGKRTLTQSLPAPIRRATDPVGAVAADADAAVREATASAGEPLRDDLRARFERSLATDLSAVRVHTSRDSASAASALGARAFAVGNDVHFGVGQYQPDDPFGLHLLAHEVAHTAQHADGSAGPRAKLEVSVPGDAAEVEADRAADAMVAGAPFTVGGASARIHRDLANTNHEQTERSSIEDRQQCITAIDRLDQAVHGARERVVAWHEKELMTFISHTGQSPSEGFSPGVARELVAKGAIKGVGALAGLGAKLLERYGLPGKLAAFAVERIGDKLAEALKEKIEGGRAPTTDEEVAAAIKRLEPALKQAIDSVTSARDPNFVQAVEACVKARQVVVSEPSKQDLADIRTWAEHEEASATALAPAAGSLSHAMLSKWVSANTSASSPHQSSGLVSNAAWRGVCKELFGVEHIPLHEWGRFQLRDEWIAMGLDPSRVLEVPYLGEGLVEFTSAVDTRKFAARWAPDRDSARYKHLVGGGAFELHCTSFMDHGNVEKEGVGQDTVFHLAGTRYVLGFGEALPEDIGTEEDHLPPAEHREEIDKMRKGVEYMRSRRDDQTEDRGAEAALAVE